MRLLAGLFCVADRSDRVIAEMCGVTQPFVGKMRAELITVISSDGRTGADGKTRKLPTPKPRPLPPGRESQPERPSRDEEGREVEERERRHSVTG